MGSAARREASQAKPSAALKKSIQERRAQAKSPISIRLVPEQIEAAKKIAATKPVPYQTQLRMWIAEGIRREAKRRKRLEFFVGLPFLLSNSGLVREYFVQGCLKSLNPISRRYLFQKNPAPVFRKKLFRLETLPA
jgi:predicted DNA binding CopG/RHH family protein